MYIDFNVKYPFFLSRFNRLEFSRQSFEECSNIKSHENPSTGTRVAL